jgi:hypothetical protein
MPQVGSLDARYLSSERFAREVRGNILDALRRCGKTTISMTIATLAFYLGEAPSPRAPLESNTRWLVRTYMDALEENPQLLPGWRVEFSTRSNRRCVTFTSAPSDAPAQLASA